MSEAGCGETRSVFTAIVGRPNVGKSSLLNRLVGERAAIVTPKPQTTRTRVTGVLTRGEVQYVFIDTPGLHSPRTKLGGSMMRAVRDGAQDGDVVLMLFEPAGEISGEERQMLASLAGRAAIAGVNKADTVRMGEKLAARVQLLCETGIFAGVYPLSAHTGEGCGELLGALARHAAAGPHFFQQDAYTDQTERVLVAELIREKLLLYLRDELPHGAAVRVERFHEREGGIADIDAVIYCERKSHKGMVIGKGGAMLKRVASAAREDAEELLGTRIYLQCRVKVREGWRDDEKALRWLGFGGG